MKKITIIFTLFFISISCIFAQEKPNEYAGKEIGNLVSAVKAANPGDYILLPSGRKYILTKEEIDIINGRFDFSDLSGVKTETLNDGTEIKTLSEAHTAYIFPDGQSTHMLKTDVSFTNFMQQYIERNYYLGHYIDIMGKRHDAMPNGSPRFYVFRARVQFQTISDGLNNAEVVVITAYNYRGENFVMRYFSTDTGWTWGHVRGNFRPVGETRQIDFDIE